MATREVEKSEAAKQAARFFLPFCQAGQLKRLHRQQRLRDASLPVYNISDADIKESAFQAQTDYQKPTEEHSLLSKVIYRWRTPSPIRSVHYLHSSYAVLYTDSSSYTPVKCCDLPLSIGAYLAYCKETPAFGYRPLRPYNLTPMM